MIKDKSPFLNFNHVGWVVKDINKAVEYFEALGIGPWERYTLPSPGREFTKREQLGKPAEDYLFEIALAKWGPIAVELLEPVTGDSIAKRWLETKGEGIWHLGCPVDTEQFDKAVAEMTEKGFKVLGSSTFTSGSRMVWFDTDKVGGITFQLHEVTAELAKIFSTLGERLA